MIVEDDSDIATESTKTVSDIIAIVQSSLATEGVPSLKSVLKRWEAYLEAANRMLSPFSKMEKLPIVWNSSLPQLISLWLGEAGRMVEPIISNSHRIPRLPSLIYPFRASTLNFTGSSFQCLIWNSPQFALFVVQ